VKLVLTLLGSRDYIDDLLLVDRLSLRSSVSRHLFDDIFPDPSMLTSTPEGNAGMENMIAAFGIPEDLESFISNPSVLDNDFIWGHEQWLGLLNKQKQPSHQLAEESSASAHPEIGFGLLDPSLNKLPEMASDLRPYQEGSNIPSVPTQSTSNEMVEMWPATSDNNM
jgi:hypothetical protein